MMVNKVFLLGNLGRGPKVGQTASGQAVANLSVATNRRWKNAEGERQEATEWHSVVCFGRLAEIAGQYLARGRQVFIEGRLQTRSWEDVESGETKYRTEIVARSLQMLGSAGGAGMPLRSDGEGGSEPEDDDIPF